MRIAVFFLGLLSISITSLADETPRACKGAPDVVGPCVLVQGAIQAHQGTPTYRLSTKGSPHLLGLSGRGDLPGEEPVVPENLAAFIRENSKAMLEDGKAICGTFVACPFEKLRNGSLQRACVESAQNLSLGANARSCATRRPQ